MNECQLFNRIVDEWWQIEIVCAPCTDQIPMVTNSDCNRSLTIAEIAKNKYVFWLCVSFVILKGTFYVFQMFGNFELWFIPYLQTNTLHKHTLNVYFNRGVGAHLFRRCCFKQQQHVERHLWIFSLENFKCFEIFLIHQSNPKQCVHTTPRT